MDVFIPQGYDRASVVVGRGAVRVGSLSVNCPNGKRIGIITKRVGTNVGDNRLAYLLKTGNVNGSALLHALSTFRPGLDKRVFVRNGRVRRCGSGRLSVTVDMILARGYRIHGVAMARLIKLKHAPCANF